MNTNALMVSTTLLPFIDDEERLMAKQHDLDYVGQKIIDVFRERFPNDEGYIQEKIHRLSEMNNKYETFSWALNQLDYENQCLLFEKLGINILGLKFYNHLFQQI
ncbi:hypothetical protein [Acinetobacter sp. SK-43]|uniref:hypothetical protein n=1 Tax=Acinetobacter sp. SK-43 TaxID=2785295 RepID=UPI001D0E838F|nr:hypothetical protein [Acinetobacter sp. SK-43]